MRARFFWPRRQRHGVATERPRLIAREERPLSAEEWRVPEGLKTVAEVWTAQLEKELRRVFPIPKDYDAEEAWSKVDAATIDEVRVITYTQPSLVTGVPKKKPDLMENRVGGGSIEDRIKYARGLLAKEIPVTEFCREGSMIDVAAITKGKGWKGHHTRWGTRLLSHKNSKHR